MTQVPPAQRGPGVGSGPAQQLLPMLGGLAAVGLIVGAYLAGGGGSVELSPVLGGTILAIPLLGLTTLLAWRRPAIAVGAAAMLMVFHGTVLVNQGRSLSGLVWLLLGGVLIATIAYFLTSTRTRPLVVWPGIAMLAVYFLFVAAHVPFAETTEIGVRAFAAGPAAIVVFFAVAYAPWGTETRWSVGRAIVLVCVVAGLYAMYKLVTGPTAAEAPLGKLFDTSLAGSFANRVELAGWAAVTLPFLFTFALGSAGRLRVLSSVGFVLMCVALLGSEVRVSLVAVAVGIGFALLLYQLARAFRSAKLAPLVLAVAGLLIAGTVAYSATIAASPTQVDRYEKILDPGSDLSFQRRVRKWKEAIDQINREPLGQGIGTTGSAQRQFSREQRLDNFFIDNSYLELGIQFGYPGLVLFGLSMVLLLYMLAKTAVQTADRRRATIAIGGTSALVGWLIDMLGGDRLELWGATGVWLLAGLAAGCFVSSGEHVPRPRLRISSRPETPTESGPELTDERGAGAAT